MHFIKSKYFVVTLVVALVLTLVPATMAAMGITAPLSNLVTTVSTPFVRLFEKISGGVRGFSAYFTEFDALREENERLRKALYESERKNAEGVAAKEENAALREYLRLPEYGTDFRTVDAMVIAASSGNAGRSYTLNRGTAHGVAVGMPVITDEGLVGRVSEAGIGYCRVIPLTEMNFSASAYVERSGALGTCEGNFSLREDGLCRMTGLSADTDIEVGDRILTSGHGSVYPAGIVIGYVTEVGYDSYARAKVAVIRPAAETEGLSRVMILTEYEIIAVRPETSGTGGGSSTGTEEE